MEKKKVYTVWESDSNGRDYPTFYEDKNEAYKHFNDSKKEKPQYPDSMTMETHTTP